MVLTHLVLHHTLSHSAGASGAWLGTAFLTTTEALTEPWQRNLLLSDSGPETTVTQVFTGKAARGLATEIAVAGAEVQEKLPGLFGLVSHAGFWEFSLGFRVTPTLNPKTLLSKY